MRASMLGVDEGYVIDGAAMIFCCIQVKHPAEVLESQDGCELPPPDLVALVPEESKENPADSVVEDVDADDDNDVDDTNDANEAAHVLQSHDGCDVPSRDLVDLPQEQSNAGSKIEDLRNKLEESSNRIVALGIEINTLKDLRSRENKQFGIEINTLKDLRSRENKQFKDARFQTNENHKNALKQMADKMKDIKIELRKSYENAREQDKRACQENEKLREENKKPRQGLLDSVWEEHIHCIVHSSNSNTLHQISSSGVPFPSVNNQDLLHLHGSDMLQSSHSSYQSQTSGPPGIGLRLLNSPNTVSGMVSYDQQHQHQSQFQMQQMSGLNQSYTDQGVKSMQSAQAAPDSFGFLGLLRRMRDPNLRSLALGIDLTTRGLNLNSTKNLNETFGSPWSDEPAMGDPEFIVPQCYYAKQPPALSIQQRLVLSQRAPAMVNKG